MLLDGINNTKVQTSELKTSELDTLNTDCLIWISTVNSFDFCFIRSFPLFLDFPTGLRPIRALSLNGVQSLKLTGFCIDTTQNFRIDLDIHNSKVFSSDNKFYCRADHPDDDWFHLVGLIHDLGKVMAFFGEPQWAVVGDTFPVGCKPQVSFSGIINVI